MKREFLDSGKLLVNAVTDWLLAQARVTPGSARALDHLLVVVPTSQSGRRLRLALAERTGGCIPPRICLPQHLIVPAREPAFPTATPTESMGILADLLTRLDLAAFPDLFPAQGHPSEQAFPWALNVSRQLHDLWRILQENALTMGDVAARVGHLLHGDDLDTEIRRWQDLARLETQFFSDLARLRLTPITLARQPAAHDPAIPEGIEQIILPALADAQPALYTALSKLANAITVTVLIHADASDDARFDVYGRPEPSHWTGANAPQLPLTDAQITLATNSPEQARHAAEHYASRTIANGRPPALGMADDTLFNELQRAFLARGVTLHNPAASPVAASSLGRLIRLVGQLAAGQNFSALSAFLREADVQRWADTLFQDIPSFAYADALKELDALQNKHLPQTFEDALHHSKDAPGFRQINRVLAQLDVLLNLSAATYNERLLIILNTLFTARTVHSNVPGDRELIAAAAEVRTLLDEADSRVLHTVLDSDQIVQLFSASLTAATYQLEHDIPQTVSTEGWLELQWHPTPELIITGFNEGIIPDSVVGHAFLPDRLRQGLGLTSNAQRLARDTCLLHALLLSRAPGAVHLLLERVSAAKDIRKPSRLLFLCDDATFVARAKSLFSDPENVPAGHPRTLPSAWRLALPYPAPAPDTLRVTDFKDYLTCPFTFYLRNVLKMKPQDDRLQELDALAFGSLCHQALDAFANSPGRDADDPAIIRAFLENHVWQTLHSLFGSSLTVVLHLQGAAACERLAFAAQEQARLVAQGWRIHAAEQSATLNGLGATIRGRIDRMDRHEASGAFRILDYKTWARLGDNNGLDRFSTAKHATVETAQANGFPAFTFEDAKKSRVWTDLQLPLYLLMAQASGLAPNDATIECGYFVLGDTAADTQVKAWDFSSLRGSAEETARHVIGRIQAGIFWPPQAIAQEFLPLLLDPAAPDTSISPDWLADQQNRSGNFTK